MQNTTSDMNASDTSTLPYITSLEEKRRNMEEARSALIWPWDLQPECSVRDAPGYLRQQLTQFQTASQPSTIFSGPLSKLQHETLNTLNTTVFSLMENMYVHSHFNFEKKWQYAQAVQNFAVSHGIYIWQSYSYRSKPTPVVLHRSTQLRRARYRTRLTVLHSKLLVVPIRPHAGLAFRRPRFTVLGG